MNRKTYLTMTAVAASLALPAAAPAATANSSASVRADVKASVQAFEKVQALTEADRDHAAAAKLRLGLRELRAAARTTARMQANATGDGAHLRVVRAQRMIGQCADLGATVLADVVTDADASVEIQMATAISSLLAIQQRAIDALGSTIAVASAAVDAVAIKAIVTTSANATGIVSAISTVLASGEVSAAATVKLDSALQLATNAVSSGLTVLQTISGDVSATAQVGVNSAISQITSALGQAQASLQATVETVSTTTTGAVSSVVLPTLGNALGAVSEALSVAARVQAEIGADAAVVAG